MFKWRSDKNRITAVFKLQFYATQVSEFGGNGLVLSIVPAENGKPTAKLEKCEMRDSDCYWDRPVYETVKLIQDPRTGKFQDRIYYFIISTGSPKGSLVGEFSVNMADYVAATKACSVSFPFKNSNSNSHLHVLIQRIQESGNQRYFEENEGQNINPEDRSLRRHFSNGDVDEGIKANSIGDEPLRKTVSHVPVLNGVRRGSNGSDITLSSSDSDQTSNGSIYQDQQRTRWDLAIVPVNGLSTDYSMTSPRDAFSSDRSQIGLDDSVEKLKADLVALSRRADVSELELQTLRKQIVKESKKGQDLLREITGLKEERDSLKDECEKLKKSRMRSDELKVRSKLQFEGDQWTLLEEIKEELTYEKDLNANLRLQLQKTQEANAELILAVQDLEDMLEKNKSRRPNRSVSGESVVETDEIIHKCESDDEDQKALEELVRQHSDAQETYLLEQKIMDLCSELEMYRRDKDELEMQMEQLALDYEILKQENHEFSCRLEQSHLQEQLKMPYNEPSSSHVIIKELETQREKLQTELREQSKELSHCLATIKELEACNRGLEEELEKQAKGFESDKEAVVRAHMEQEQRAARAEEALSQSAAAVNELEAEIQKLKKQLKQELEELSGCFGTIEELETHNQNLEDELEKQAQGFRTEMEALVHAKMEQEQRALRAEEAVARSNSTINELDSRIKMLENELKTRSEESSDTLAKLKEFESHIQDLEEELEKQAEGFEADLEEITRAKVEQEQRAIRAEEALRLMRWKNANTAARIQDEFKRLSTQMQSSFEANEKLASKALTEASELRLQNRHLQDMLQRANEELESAKDDYEARMQELYGQINMKSAQIEQMTMEFDQKSQQFENQRKQEDDLQRSVSAQLVELRAEIERLTSENKLLAEQAEQGERLKSELEHMKALNKEDLLDRGKNTETENLEGIIASMKEEGGKSLEEINILRHLKDEKEQLVMNLHSEVEALRAQCDNLKHTLYEDELEKEKLRAQVFQLKADLKKKDDAISNIEKKSKESSVRGMVQDKSQDKSRTPSKNTKPEPMQRGSKEIGAKEVVTLKEKVKFLEGQIKSKETALETSANAFLAKEKDLQGKIEKLEIRLGENGLSSPSCRQDNIMEKVSLGMQVDCVAEEVLSAGVIPEEVSLTESEAQTSANTQPEFSDNNSGEQQKFDILLKEMVVLKEKNDSMENELKEMQERYSEMSLKFAEVEGERQKLIMTVRSLKNSKKG